MAEDTAHELGYDDLLRIVELVKASERYARFHLKVGEFEIELRRRESNGSLARVPGTSPTATASASPE